MTDVLIVGDIHLADKAPSSRRDSYAAEILAKLEWCVAEANKLDVPLVLAGDVFHIKTPWRTSYALVVRTWLVLSKAKYGVFIVPGNHDMSQDRLDSIPSQPLGALCTMPNIHLLVGRSELLPGIVGIPYLTEFDGGDWQKAVDDHCQDFGLDDDPYKPNELLVTHAPIFPSGAEPNVYAHIKAVDWAARFGDGQTYYGHIHDSHGVYVVNGGHTLANHGAISRGSLHEATVNRWPTVTWWKAQQFIAIALPDDVVKPPEDVFLFAEASTKTAAKSSAQEFADAVGSVQLVNLTIEEVIAAIKDEGPTPNVMAIVESVLEEAQ